MKNIFKTIIFDLDDTLYDTSGRLDDATPNFEGMKLLPGVREILEQIKAKKILLTHGSEAIQNKKIDTLGLKNLFDEIIIVATNAEKLSVFEKIKSEFPNPKEVAVVGDRRDAEIRFGNICGFTTILIPGFKYKSLAPKDDLEIPAYEIRAFSDLTNLF